MSNFTLSIILLFYSTPLGVIFLLYNVFSSIERADRVWKIDLAVLIFLIFLTYYYRNIIDIHAIIDQPRFIWNTYKQGFIKGLQSDFHAWPQIFQHGLFIVLIIPFFIKIINSYLVYCNRLKVSNSKLSNKHQDQEAELATSTFLGTVHNQKILVADKELNQHCLVIGTTGAGKTTTILNFVESAARRNLSCIYLDGKGSPELIDKLRTIADKYNRKFKVFSLRPKAEISETASYNPFGSGNATEWKNRIMSLFAEAQGKGQEHFSLAEQNYINFVSNVLYGLGQKDKKSIDLRALLTFLETREYLMAAANQVDPVMAEKLEKLHDDENNVHMATDVIKLLELFIYSSYGHLFNTHEKTNIINLQESILNNEIVLFLFDASAYLEDTKKIAKMVINDINSCFAGFDKFTPAFCIFDEFASYASSNLSETISLQRSKGLHGIIGTQSIASVKLKSMETKRVAEELIACCNTYIIQTINHDDDANLFAKVIGMKEQVQYTTTLYDRPTDMEENAKAVGSARLMEKFIISPQQIKELKQGEAILYRKAAHKAPIKIKVNLLY